MQNGLTNNAYYTANGQSGLDSFSKEDRILSFGAEVDSNHEELERIRSFYQQLVNSGGPRRAFSEDSDDEDEDPGRIQTFHQHGLNGGGLRAFGDEDNDDEDEPGRIQSWSQHANLPGRLPDP